MLWRRLRGILGMGIMWGVLWAPALALVSSAVFVGLGLPLSFAFLLRALGTGFSWGFAAGALFGGVLMLAEQQRGFGKLTPWRGAAWGVIGGLWFPIALIVATRRSPASMIALFSITVGFMGLMGAASGWLTVRLARAGREPAEPAALEGGDPLDLSSAELTSTPSERVR